METGTYKENEYMSIRMQAREVLKALHHNAKVNYPSIEDDYEQDAFDAWFSDVSAFAMEDLALEFPTLGSIYQYGRGGATLAPSMLIPNHNYAHADLSLADTMSEEELIDLVEQLTRFNAEVKAWCHGIADRWEQEKADNDDLRERITANKGKRRRSVVVYN